MRCFVIKDDTLEKGLEIGYLIYYEESKKFYIEIKDNISSHQLPIFLSSFLKKGCKSVNSYWSYLWVSDRIVPKDRQNINSILREYGLDSYNEFKMLIKNHGRCEQDESYLEEISNEELCRSIKTRQFSKVDEVIPLKGNNLLVSFYDGKIKKCNIEEVVGNSSSFMPILNDEKLFNRVEVLPGGYEVVFCNNQYISDIELYAIGVDTNLSKQDFIDIYKNEIINVKEAQEILNCSRQNINDLIKRGKLKTIKESEKNTLLLKSEVLKRKWK